MDAINDLNDEDCREMLDQHEECFVQWLKHLR